jgi:hypothetical protein
MFLLFRAGYSIGNAKEVGPPGLGEAGMRVSEISVILVQMGSGL